MHKILHRGSLPRRFWKRLENKANDWGAFLFLAIPVLGLVFVFVDAVTIFFAFELMLSVFWRLNVTMIIEALIIFWLLINLDHPRTGFAIQQGPWLADIILNLLIFLAIVVSVAALLLSFVTAYVLVLPLIYGGLFYLAYEVTSKYGDDREDAWFYNDDGFRWWRVRCVAVLVGLVTVLLMIKNGGIVFVPGRSLEIKIELIWPFVWFVATYVGSVLVGGIRWSRPSEKFS